jgi:hypothetical protein
LWGRCLRFHPMLLFSPDTGVSLGATSKVDPQTFQPAQMIEAQPFTSSARWA